MSNSNSLLETEHFKINEEAYHRLAGRSIEEVIRCLLVAEAPSELTMDKVRNRSRIFAACSTEPWARVTDVIQPKAGGRGAPSNVLKKEYYRLLRTLRDQLVNTLLHKEREVWKKARQRMINEAKYVVFRVTESAVHLHRLMHNRQYRHYD